MLVVVTTIYFLVHLYYTEYIKEYPHVSRFMGYLSLFTFFMIVLVTGNNFFQPQSIFESSYFLSHLNKDIIC